MPSLYGSASWESCPLAPATTWPGCWAGAASVTMTRNCCRSWRSWNEPLLRCWTGGCLVGATGRGGGLGTPSSWHPFGCSGSLVPKMFGAGVCMLYGGPIYSGQISSPPLLPTEMGGCRGGEGESWAQAGQLQPGCACAALWGIGGQPDCAMPASASPSVPPSDKARIWAVLKPLPPPAGGAS